MSLIPAPLRRKVGIGRATRRMFLTDDGNLNRDGAVLWADLKRFCFVDKSTGTAGDKDLMLILEGRRQVYLRIKDHMAPDKGLSEQLEQLQQLVPDE